MAKIKKISFKDNSIKYEFFINKGTLEEEGIVQLTNIIDDSQELALTPFAVKNALDEINSNMISYVDTPQIISPTHNATNQNSFLTIAGSEYRNVFSDDVRLHREFQVSEFEDFRKIYTSKNVNEDTYKLETQLRGFTSYYLRIRDFSQKGFKSKWSETIKITTGDAVDVISPTVTLKGYNNSPTDILSGFSVSASAFAVEGGVSDTHLSTDWYITLQDSTNKVWESMNDTSHKTSITIPDGTLVKSTNYSLYTIYRGSKYGESEPTITKFTTSDDFGTVNAPTLTVTGAPNDVLDTPTLSGGVFSNTRVKDTHVMTDWVIVDSNKKEVWSSKDDETNKRSIKIPKKVLKTSSLYTAKVRYKGNKYGWSEYTEVEFSTVDAFYKVKTPTLTCNQTLTSVQPNADFTSSDFVLELGSDGVHGSTDWILYKGDSIVFRSLKNKLYLTECPDISKHFAINTEYTLKARYYDSENDVYSEYAELKFTSAEDLRYVVTPTLRIEGTSSDAVTFDSQFISSEFESSGFESYLYYIDWIILKDGEEIWYKKNMTPPILNIGASPVPMFEPNTTYVLRCRHRSRSPSIWSKYAELEFTTASEEVYPKPTIKFKMKTQIQLNRLCKWWNTTKLKVYKNGVYDDDLTKKPSTVQTLSEEGDIIEIKNEVDDLYPYMNFYTHADYLMSIEAPLPPMRTSNNIGMNYLQTNFGGVATGGKSGAIGYGMFYDCKLLETLPNELFRYNPQITDFGGIGSSGSYGGAYGQSYRGKNAYGCFYGCTGLTSIPEDLFKYSILITSVDGKGGNGGNGGSTSGGVGYGCFQGCTSLTSIPENLFRYNANIKIFGGQGGIGGNSTATGTGIYSSGQPGGAAYGCFNNCTGLTEIPENLFRYNVNATSFGGVGGNAGNDAPTHYSGNGGNGGAGYGMFANCTGLTEIPENLFKYNTNATDFGNAGNSSASTGNAGKGYGPFYKCSNLVVNVRIGSPNVTSATYFANGTKEVGTVLVPSGSTTAETFKKSQVSANVNVIEE